MFKKIILLSLVCVLVFIGFRFLLSTRKLSVDNSKIKVTASFYPYYFIASFIGGEKAIVKNITPSGAEPHDYDLSPGDIVQIESSKLLIMNGKIEPWAKKINKLLDGKPVRIVQMDESLFSQVYKDEEGVTSGDPHIWLSPKLFGYQTKIILNEFKKVDPDNSVYYDQNAEKLNDEIANIGQEYASGLTSCSIRKFITSHASFGYLAKEYGLTQISISGLSPEAEPSLKQLAEVADKAKTNNINYIFFESLVSPKLANTLANEVKAKTLVLNPLEGLTPEELSEGKDFISIMRDNLQSLKIALDCK